MPTVASPPGDPAAPGAYPSKVAYFDSKWAAAGGGLLAAVPAAWLFSGFTVDDALVSARVASQLAAGHGYRFNPGGPEVDAVTPLGWAHLLALAGPTDVLGMLQRGRAIGLVAWLFAAALLGVLLPKARGVRFGALAVLAVSAPLAAWASAGMETGLVTALATVALVGGPAGLLAAGLAAGLRPELLPFSLVLSAGEALRAHQSRRRALRLCWAVALVVAPAVVAGFVRQLWFGSPTPLSVIAKPSDLAHGARYAAGAFVLTAAPLLLLDPGALRRAELGTRVLALAVVVHFAAVALAGGDWMALYRLAVPVLPAALLAGARLGTASTPRRFACAVGIAVALSLVLGAYVGWPARYVLEHRVRLIAAARPALAEARSVAALDIGWVGAATQAPILDFAGITDPVVARMPGGHTSKRFGEGLLEHREVDTVILLLAPAQPPAQNWRDFTFGRQVEARVAAFEVLNSFEVHAMLPLGGTRQSYLVLRGARRP
jgi:hypothetical protein